MEDIVAEIEREQLFDIIRELVKWENSNNESVLNRARAEILRSCKSGSGYCQKNLDGFLTKGSNQNWRTASQRRSGLPEFTCEPVRYLSQKQGSFCDKRNMQKSAQPIDNSILRSIRSKPSASVFSPRHFEVFGRPDAIRKALSRLVKAGKIRRIRRGLYDLPRSHPITGQTAPNIMATVRALMDGSHAQWQFTGAYAANALGLSDQVPSKIIILTDGVPRRVSLGKLTLIFRRAAPRNLLGSGQRAGLVIQALRYLKGSPEIAKHSARLKRDLDAETKKDLRVLTPKLAVWMRPLAQEIAQK